MSTLYVVPTPIGNLDDLSNRATTTLRMVGFVATEDTRVTLKLLNHLGIKKPMVSYHEHNSRDSGARIVRRIADGETCALVTDAGTPAISDPGADLVALCAESGLPVVAMPGPCAAVTALSVSGLPAGRFCFEGFLSMNKKNRRAHLDSLRHETRTMVFYEAPHKLPNTLKDLLEALGDRPVVLCRELTKVFEEVRRTTLSAAAEHYARVTPRGEFVLVVPGESGGTSEEQTEAEASDKALSLALALVRQGSSTRDAVHEATLATGARRGDVYTGVLQALRDPPRGN